MRIGASRIQPRRYSIRSRKVGSAHWRSSKAMTSGCLREVLEQPAHGPHRLLGALVLPAMPIAPATWPRPSSSASPRGSSMRSRVLAAGAADEIAKRPGT